VAGRLSPSTGMTSPTTEPDANNESSEVFDTIKPGRRVKIIHVTGSKMSTTSDDSLFANRIFNTHYNDVNKQLLKYPKSCTQFLCIRPSQTAAFPTFAAKPEGGFKFIQPSSFPSTRSRSAQSSLRLQA